MRIGVTANVGGDPERVRYPVVRLVALPGDDAEAGAMISHFRHDNTR
jgi:hypothetical protein